MKTPLALVLGLSVLMITSCATYRIIPLPSEGAEIRYDRGSQVLIIERGAVALAASGQVNGGKIYFHTVVKNLGDKSIYVDDSHFRLEETTADGKTKELKIYRADEYLKKRRSEIVTAQVLMAVSAALSTINAGTSTYYSSGSFSYSGYGRHSYYHGFGNYSGSTTVYNSAQAQLEREIAFANVQDFVNGSNAELEYLRNTLFFPTDVPPNGEYYGIIVGENSEASNSTLRMSFEPTIGWVAEANFRKESED